MKIHLIWLFLPLLSLQDDPIQALKAVPAEKALTDGKKLLVGGLENEMKLGLQALEAAKFGDAEAHLVRAAQLSRPYSEDHARRVVRIVLGLRTCLRSEGVALVKAMAEDLRTNRPELAERRLNDARQTSLLGKACPAELDALARWIKTPPTPAIVEAEITKWKTYLPPSAHSSCATCKGAGELDCPSCQTGLITTPCRTCTGKGQTTCILCEGKGTLTHAGCVGHFRINLEKEIQVTVPMGGGKTARARLWPQVVTWETGPCNGTGEFSLLTSSRPKDPNIKPMDSLRVTRKCGDFFREMKNFVFSGKATIENIENIAKPVLINAEAAKRLFAEYEKCKDGRVPCDRCAGKLQTPCEPCGAKGARLLACSECSGSMMISCQTCRLSGDSAWLAALIPAASVPEVARGLADHASRLGIWQDRWSQQLARREQMRQRLDEARQGLDATARIEPDFVSVTCPTCKGKGGTCEDCWGAGRKEYFEGTPQYDRYAAAGKLALQVAEIAKNSLALTPKLEIKKPEEIAAKRNDPPPVVVPEIKGGGGGSSVGGSIGGLPDDLQAQVRAGTAAYEEGKAHLEKAKSSQDAETWKSESKLALSKLRESQRILTTVQETLDERGIDVPRELLDLVRNMMQAMVMARKQSP